MKTLIFLMAILPSLVHGQTCHPFAQIGGYHGKTEITTKDLVNLKTLEVGGGCTGAKVISFEFTVRVKGQPMTFTGVGAGVSSDMRKAIAEMSKKSSLFFDNVRAKFPDGTTKTIPGITLVMKD